MFATLNKDTKLSKGQCGFTVIHVLLFLGIVGIICFAGWRVYGVKNVPKQTASPVSNYEAWPKVTVTNNPFGNQASTSEERVIQYKDEDLNFTYSIPETWPHDDPQVFPAAEYSHEINNTILYKYNSENKEWSNIKENRVVFVYLKGNNQEISPWGLGTDIKICRDIYTFIAQDKMVELQLPPSPTNAKAANCTESSYGAETDEKYGTQISKFLSSLTKVHP